MPAKVCCNCGQKKAGVKLCADDLLCPECYTENERKLATARGGSAPDNVKGDSQPCNNVVEASVVSEAPTTVNPPTGVPNQCKKLAKQTKQTTKKTAVRNTDDVVQEHPETENQKLSKNVMQKTVSAAAFTFNDESDDENSCPICLLPTSSTGGASIKCDICSIIYHSRCVKIADITDGRLTQLLSEIGWVCYDCKHLARGQCARFQALLSSMAAEVASLQARFLDLSLNLKSANNSCNVAECGKAHSQAESNVATDGQSTATESVVQAPLPQHDKFDDINSAVCKVIRDTSRRKHNVIISGIPESSAVTDRDAVLQLCSENLPVKPLINDSDCTRIGKPEQDKPRRLLLRLRSECMSRELLQSAPLLRKAVNQDVAKNVFINPDLSPSEAKLAYEMRKARREKRQQRDRRLTHGEPHSEMNHTIGVPPTSAEDQSQAPSNSTSSSSFLH
jgi:hypothetical protein